jgi:hypothetical protein
MLPFLYAVGSDFRPANETGESMTYVQWMEAAEVAVQSATGMSIHDLPDVAFRDLYEDGAEPLEAAAVALAAADFPAEYLEDMDDDLSDTFKDDRE